MAELSVEEAQNLARQFLTGLAGPREVARLQAALPEDQTLALELLAQIQTSLEDVAPEGLSKEQGRIVDERVEALIAPRIRQRGVMSRLLGVFRGKPRHPRKSAPEAEEARPGVEPPAPPAARAAPSVYTAPAAAPAPATASAGGPEAGDLDAVMEEVAPIAASPAEPAPIEAQPLDSWEQIPGSAAEPAPARPQGPALRPLWAGLSVLAVAAVAAGAWWLWSRRVPGVPAKPKPAPVQVAAAPKPAPPKPAPAPAEALLPRRERAVAPPRSEVLPAEIGAQTPADAGEPQSLPEGAPKAGGGADNAAPALLWPRSPAPGGAAVSGWGRSPAPGAGNPATPTGR